TSSHPDQHPFPTRRSSDLLLVEGPEVFARTAAAAHDDCVNAVLASPLCERALMVFVQNFYRARDLQSSAVALHARGRDEDADGRSEEHTSELQSPYDLVCW